MSPFSRRLGGTEDALGVLPEAELAESHRERVVEEQPTDEGLPDPEKEFDGLGRLDHPDESGQNAEHPALRAQTARGPGGGGSG